ncbi:6138_t:CDS:2 [Cetraspora pellucida]|uniref:6138_t:CDS:1 n=1 Tax=Cetraspora pellucida TaxID=1433469 RepID=A0ACA9N3D3_9GLOM|nr:6138_t:CDS:2 [Cetraspora pellucida]
MIDKRVGQNGAESHRAIANGFHQQSNPVVDEEVIESHISNLGWIMVDYLIIGGGVVGLAVAERLSKRKGKSTLLVEKNSRVNEEIR